VKTGSFPIIALGVLLVIIALVQAPWPAHVEEARYTVSHIDRLTGQDTPSDDAERPPGYVAFRVFDALVYFALAQILLATGAMVWRDDSFFLLLVILGAVYGLIYSTSLGLVVGPQMASVGFTFILVAASIGYLTTGERNATYSIEGTRDRENQGL
jgi:hypothetical protein